MKIMILIIFCTCFAACVSGAKTCDLPDEEYRVIEKPRQLFPKKAFDQKISGWVELEYSISNTGKATNIKIVKEEPEGVFSRSAIEAVKNTKYSPRRVNCRNVKVKRVRNKIHYEYLGENA